MKELEKLIADVFALDTKGTGKPWSAGRGPYVYGPNQPHEAGSGFRGIGEFVRYTQPMSKHECEANAELTAHYRTSAVQLARVVEVLIAQRDGYRGSYWAARKLSDEEKEEMISDEDSDLQFALEIV